MTKHLLFGFGVIWITNGVGSENIAVEATRVQSGLQLDGVLQEEVWRNAKPFSEFRMVEPNPDQAPSERTELRVVYDNEALYLGITCYDSEPDKIKSNTLAHDVFDEDVRSNDLLRIIIDPIQDRRNAFLFAVNASGARSEGFALGEHCTLNWDGLWDAQCHVDRQGWTAEIQIPFKTLMFKSGLTRWGINVERYIPRKLETIRLAGPTPDRHFFNPTEAGALIGIENIQQGNGLTIRPYGRMSDMRETNGSGKRVREKDGGIDVYKYFTPNLVGAFSYRTDFAETEVDDRQINTSRFPLLYPEKRAFFLEGSNIFEFGPNGMNFYPFFSRTMGLYRGNPIPIRYGARLFGKLGRTNLAVLNVNTEARPDLHLADQQLFAARISQDLWSESRIGLIATYGNPAGNGRNSLIGADFRYLTSQFRGNKNFSMDTWYTYNQNTRETGQHYAYGLKLDYPNDLWDMNFLINHYGDAMEPALGYIRRTAASSVSSNIQYMPRPANGMWDGLIRQWFFWLSGSQYWDLAGTLETRYLSFAPISGRTEGGHYFGLYLGRDVDVLKEPFKVAEAVAIPSGRYEFGYWEVEYSSPSFWPVMISTEYRNGDYYSGKMQNTEVEMKFRYNGNLNLGLNYDWIHGDLAQGDYDERVYQMRCDFYLSSRLGLLNYIQYDDVSQNLGANIRFRWELVPGNLLYLVYNKNWEKRSDPRSRFLPMDEKAVFKVQLTMRP
jgi:hypothetical protein